MPDSNKKRIRFATTIYWLLLFYIVAALVWWFISLEKQNRQMTDFKISQLNAVTDPSHNPGVYSNSMAKIKEEHKRNWVKYISEGSTFLLLILIGAAFVYRSVRKQFLLQQQQQNLVSSLKTGDRVVTNAGIHGLISNVKENTVLVKVADNVKIEMEKSAITNVLKES